MHGRATVVKHNLKGLSPSCPLFSIQLKRSMFIPEFWTSVVLGMNEHNDRSTFQASNICMDGQT